MSWMAPGSMMMLEGKRRSRLGSALHQWGSATDSKVMTCQLPLITRAWPSSPASDEAIPDVAESGIASYSVSLSPHSYSLLHSLSLSSISSSISFRYWSTSESSKNTERYLGPRPNRCRHVSGAAQSRNASPKFR